MAIFPSLLAARNRIGRKDESDIQDDVNCNYCDETTGNSPGSSPGNSPGNSPGHSPQQSPTKNPSAPFGAGSAGCQQQVVTQDGFLQDCHTRNVNSQLQTADKCIQEAAGGRDGNGNAAFVRSRSINEWVILDMKLANSL